MLQLSNIEQHQYRDPADTVLFFANRPILIHILPGSIHLKQAVEGWQSQAGLTSQIWLNILIAIVGVFGEESAPDAQIEFAGDGLIPCLFKLRCAE